jgi:hypothetical protein
MAGVEAVDREGGSDLSVTTRQLDTTELEERVKRQAIEAAGFAIETWRESSAYRFVSKRAANATQKYGVTSVSLLARRR